MHTYIHICMCVCVCVYVYILLLDATLLESCYELFKLDFAILRHIDAVKRRSNVSVLEAEVQVFNTVDKLLLRDAPVPVYIHLLVDFAERADFVCV